MTVELAVELLLALLMKSQEISAVIAKARLEGRDTLTKDEWDSVLAADDAARARLVGLIEKAGG